MAWSPLQELVTLDQFKNRLRIPLAFADDDDDMIEHLENAHEAVMSFIMNEHAAELAAWQATADSWTADTAPRRVRAAILAEAVFNHRWRGDDTDRPKREPGHVLCAEAEGIVMSFRKPTVS